MSQKNEKEKRRLERMAEEHDRNMFERIEEATSDMDTMADGPWFKCSFDLEHGDNCAVDESTGDRVYADNDGNLGRCEELDKYDVAIHHENIKLMTIGVSTRAVGFDFFMMDTQIQTLFEILKEKLGMTQDEVDLYYKRLLLNNIRSFRESVEPQIEEAQRQARRAEIMRGIAPTNGKDILH